FLLLAVTGLSLASCKKDESATHESTETTIHENDGAETADSLQKEHNSDLSTPRFSDPAVQAYANELVKYYHEIRAAEAEGNQDKLDELLKQQVLYHQKQQEVLKPLS